MAKLSLIPAPTFKAAVKIPVPGGETADVNFTFKHKTKDAVSAWLDERDNDDSTTIMGCASGWDLDDEFNAENVTRLCQNYSGAGFAIVTAYLEELRGARVKN